MSTEYPILGNRHYEMFLTEHSSVVDLSACSRQNNDISVLAEDMDARQLVSLGLEFLKVASYLDGDLTSALKGQDAYVLDEIQKALK